MLHVDRILFWTTADLEAKRIDFQHYENAIEGCGAGRAPAGIACGKELYHQLASVRTGSGRFAQGLYQTPIAALICHAQFS